MTITPLTRHGFGHMFEAILPSGLHCTIYPDNSLELVSFQPCTWCSTNKPPETHILTNLNHSYKRQPSLHDAIRNAQLSSVFSLLPDNSLPILAYMSYTPSDLKAWPHLIHDLPHDLKSRDPYVLHNYHRLMLCEGAD